MTTSTKNSAGDWRQGVADLVPAELVRFNEPMSDHTSFRIGGPADIFLAPRSFDELLLCLEVAKKTGLPFFLLGGGTNILVSDRGIRGVVLSTAGLDCISVTGETLTAQAGARVDFNAPSAGSLFKNSRDFGAPTGKIIDELGLRGVTSGGAAIAPFHGNIFINQNNATAHDVLSLIRLAVETVARERGIRLEPEVRLVGDWLPEELSFLGAVT